MKDDNLKPQLQMEKQQRLMCRAGRPLIFRRRFAIPPKGGAYAVPGEPLDAAAESPPYDPVLWADLGDAVCTSIGDVFLHNCASRLPSCPHQSLWGLLTVFTSARELCRDAENLPAVIPTPPQVQRAAGFLATCFGCCSKLAKSVSAPRTAGRNAGRIQRADPPELS